ncbi:hypothetical protein [Demequina soli]|uniref:hypothetical protein n=1 Tax=Demequina soli TaxID=1638987 RepID=UPI000782DC49|nr:hypothetical protein [Demequina soli]
MESLRSFSDDLSRDVATSGLALELSLYDPRRREWILGDGDAPEAFGTDGFVMVLPGRAKSIGARSDGGPDLVELVSEVQDWVVDELGRGWPELVSPDGAFAGLLEPGIVAGETVWRSPGATPVAVGDLPHAPIGESAAGPRG